MAYFNNKEIRFKPRPIPDTPGIYPPDVPTPEPTEGGSTPYIPTSFVGSVSMELYINTSDNNVLHKDIQSVESYTITMKDDTNVITPIVTINTITDLTRVNYMRIGNYYYYAEVTYLQGNLYQISGSMDGLMSADYSGCSGVLSRSASKYNVYQQGDTPTATYEQIKTLEFSSGFSKELNYLLVTVGD